VNIQDGLTDNQSRNLKLDGESSILSSENTWFTFNAFRDPLTGCMARGRVVRVRGPWGWRPLWQRPFSTYKSPKFYLSFTYPS
jgi:hypothetical protein